MTKLFGTDGIRGVAYKEPMTTRTARLVGHAVACVFAGRKTRSSIVIGRDTRISGRTLERAVAAGISDAGVHVRLAGIVPTPAVAFLARTTGADAGIVISASHNPYKDNGIKVFSGRGYKLPAKMERRIERLICRKITGKQLKHVRAVKVADGTERYIDYCVATSKCCLNGMKIVLDCSNGATSLVAPEVFRQLGASVVVMNNKPSGRNINANCGSEHPEKLAREVLIRRAKAGFAFDGDGDRLIAVDECGHILSGDHIMAICAKHLKKQHRLKNNLLIVTVMSNIGLHVAMKRLGIKCIEAGVGDREVLELMRKKGSVLGGEQSGHMIFLDRHTTGDGLISAIQLVESMISEKRALSQLASFMKLFPQKLINVEVARKPEIADCPEIERAIAEAEQQLKGRGRILVRYSGTQSICRVMVEGPTTKLTGLLAQRIAIVIRKALGA